MHHAVTAPIISQGGVRRQGWQSGPSVHDLDETDRVFTQPIDVRLYRARYRTASGWR
eukprot:SAG11_NODE_968_length_6354_cov_16.546922_3_plen_57_part_00